MNKNDWVSCKQAAEILTVHSGHTVTDAYIRQLVRYGFIEVWSLGPQTKLYSKKDVEAYRVKQYNHRRLSITDALQCANCRKFKHADPDSRLSEFAKNGNARTGYHSWCKECREKARLARLEQIKRQTA